MPDPKPMPRPGKDERGYFTAGNTYGRGRPKGVGNTPGGALTSTDLRALEAIRKGVRGAWRILFEECGEERFRKIVQHHLNVCEMENREGNVARRDLFKYLMNPNALISEDDKPAILKAIQNIVNVHVYPATPEEIEIIEGVATSDQVLASSEPDGRPHEPGPDSASTGRGESRQE